MTKEGIMHKILRGLMPLILILAWAGGTWGATYYVSNSGSDAAAGTSTGAPWKTINKVNASTFADGDTVYFEKGGKWYETLIPHDSGTSTGITYASYGSGNKPIVDGSLDASQFAVGTPSEKMNNGTFESGDLTGWTVTTGGSSTIAADTTSPHGGTYVMKFTRNGTNCNVTQTITLTANTYYNISFWDKLSSGTAPSFQIKDSAGTNYLANDLVNWTATAVSLAGMAADSASWVNRSVVFKTGSDGTIIIRWIATADGVAYYDDVSIKPVQWELVSGTEYRANVYQTRKLSTTKGLFASWSDVAKFGPVYLSESAMTLGTAGSLDSGECGWDTTNNTVNVNMGGSPLGVDIKIPWRGNNVQMNAKNYIIIDGLDLRHTTIDDDTNTLGAVGAEDSASSNITVKNCTITNHWYGGVKTDTQAHGSWLVQDNTISNVWNGRPYGSNGGGNGVNIGQNNTNAIVQRNYCADNYTGIRTDGKDTHVFWNVVTRSKVNGIDHQLSTAANPIIVENNSVYHTGIGHGFSSQTGAHGAVYRNNACEIHYTAETGDPQCYCLSESNTIQMDNNAGWKSADSSSYAHIVKLTYTGQLAASDTPTAPTGCSWSSNNLLCDTMAGFKAAMATATIKDNATLKWTSDGTVGHAANTNSVGDKQLFKSSTDLSLLGGSPAINSGSNAVWSGTANVTDMAGRAITDAAGNIIAKGGTVDIGAYEFGGGNSRPGFNKSIIFR